MAEPDHSYANSEAAFTRARKVMPGGVNSPVRAFKAVGGTPLFIKEASGSTITDLDNNDYIDLVGSYGPMIVGHANDIVVAAITKAAGKSTAYGATTESEIRLAETIIEAIPAIEMVRFVNSGTEATMSAIRLARAATGRDLVVKCRGCYHGHVDALLVETGSGALTLGTPSSPGVPGPIAATTLTVDFNDLANARAAFEQYPGRIACLIVEPVAGNMGVVPPAEGYLQGLRELCTRHGTLLLFDEVMTGFRVAWGGAQVHYDVKPDITCLGKIIGGGLPVGAYGASRELMEMISPAGPVYQAGTMSGNPLAMNAGIATLELLREPGCYEQLDALSARLADGLADRAGDARVPIVVNRVGSMLNPFFVPTKDAKVTNFGEATACDTRKFATFFHAMLDGGIFLPPSQFEAWFVSTAHDKAAIDKALDVAGKAFATVASAITSPSDQT